MTWLDILILFPLLIGLVRGLMKGLIVEVASIVAIVLGFLGAKYWSGIFANWLSLQFQWDDVACSVIAYAILFAAIALVLHIFARMLSKFFQKIALGWLNRLLGGIFGAAKWGIVIMTIVLCLHHLDKQFHFLSSELTRQSVVYNYLTPYAEKAWEEIKAQMETQRDNLQRTKE